MNKYQESLEKMEQAYMDLMVFGRPVLLTDEELQEILLPLRELVNKTIPVKIQTEAKVITGNGLTMVKSGGYCPVCENYPHPDEVFCGYCGQALDREPRKVGFM